MRALRITAIALLAVLVLVGCGDDEGPTTVAGSTQTATTEEPPAEPGQPADSSEPEPANGAPEEQLERPLSVEGVIAAVLTVSGSPEQGCSELVTEAFVRTAYGNREGCEAARTANGSLADSVEVGDVSEDGERASAIAVPEGGPYGGVEVEVELVADPALGGAWLVDSLLADIPAGP